MSKLRGFKLAAPVINPPMPSELITEVTVDTLYPEVAQLLNSYIEIVKLQVGLSFTNVDMFLCLVVDEEGLIKRLPLNLLATVLYHPGTFFLPGPFIAGDAYLFGWGLVNGEWDVVSLPEEFVPVDLLGLASAIIQNEVR